MKELGEVTFMKEEMKALLDAVDLAPTDLVQLVSFPRYGRLKKKRAKEDERVGRGHFHDETPARYGRFGANGSSLARFVPEIQSFEKKGWYKQFGIQ